MATAKRKLDDRVIYPDDRRYFGPDEESSGCGTYTAAAFQYPLLGPDAITKLLIGGVLSLIPVIGSWFVAGYCVRATRRVLHGDYELPDWDDFGGDFVRGLVFTIGMFIFGMLMTLSMVLVVTIPLLIIFGVPMWAYAMARYAATDDFSAFFDIVGAYRMVLDRPGDSLVLSIATFVLIIGMSILIGIGTVFFVVPGLMMAFALGLALAFNAGVYGRGIMA